MHIEASSFLVVAINPSDKKVWGGFERIQGYQIKQRKHLTLEEAKAQYGTALGYGKTKGTISRKSKQETLKCCSNELAHADNGLHSLSQIPRQQLLQLENCLLSNVTTILRKQTL